MKILIATDGSEFSQAALDVACQMVASPEKNAIKVISVFEPPFLPAPEPYVVSPDYYDKFEKELEGQARAAAEHAARRIRERFPALNGNLTTQISRGAPEKAIVEEARNWGADLIVVGSHGYGFWSRMLLGSVSTSVVRHPPCSVLVVKKPLKTKAEEEKIIHL